MTTAASSVSVADVAEAPEIVHTQNRKLAWLPRWDRDPRWMKWRARLAFLAPPVGAYVLSTVLFWFFAKKSKATFFGTADRFRWDSFHYLNIARDGYEMYRCGDRFPTHPAPDSWCGEAAWFPLYPMVVRVTTALGFSEEFAAVFVPEAALLGMFVALWWLLGAKLNSATALCLALAVVFPGSIYFHAAFPISIGTLGLLVCLVGLKKNSWLIAGVGGAVAASAHLVGAAVIGMLLFSMFFAWRSDSGRIRAAKALGASALAGLGLLWTGWLMYQGTGRWDAYSETQRVSYGQGDVENPFDSLQLFYNYQLEPPDSVAGGWLTDGISVVLHDQLSLNIGIVVLALVVTAVRLWRHRRLDVVDYATLVMSIGIFLVPFFGGAWLSWYRNHAQLFVLILLLRDAPRWVQGLLVVVCAAVAAPLSAAFFYGTLV